VNGDAVKNACETSGCRKIDPAVNVADVVCSYRSQLDCDK
jgi:hypothetical protein